MNQTIIKSEVVFYVGICLIGIPKGFSLLMIYHKFIADEWYIIDLEYNNKT